MAARGEGRRFPFIFLFAVKFPFSGGERALWAMERIFFQHRGPRSKLLFPPANSLPAATN